MTSVYELGGGDNPVYCRMKGNGTNVDCRASAWVDIVADLNELLPIDSEVADVVFSRYAIEHINWRNVRGFVAETYRILKSDGILLLVMPNLYEQCKVAIQEINQYGFGKDDYEKVSCMIFGDNNYNENSHKCGFSPISIKRLLLSVGYRVVDVKPLSGCTTDMIVEAHK